MVKRSKKYVEKLEKVSRDKEYSLEEGLELVKILAYTKFPSTIEFHGILNLAKGTDPRTVRADLTLPHSFKQEEVRVAVAVPVDLKDKAKQAGADLWDFETIKKQIESGKMEFDILLAVPQVMPELAKYGKQLGPKGLMPTAKTGTIINNVSSLKSLINEFKKGRVTIKTDKTGVVHFAFGTVEQSNTDLKENLMSVLTELSKTANRPVDRLFKKAYLAPTMGPSVKIKLLDK